jgi:hypothetical protein
MTQSVLSCGLCVARLVLFVRFGSLSTEPAYLACHLMSASL